MKDVGAMPTTSVGMVPDLMFLPIRSLSFGRNSVMIRWKKSFWPIAVGIGFAAGLILSGLWPNIPLHAVCTDRTDTYAIATGPVDSEVEAVYFLDFLTGDLVAMVLGKQPNMWSGFFRTNVSADLGIDPQKNPKLLMVTGMAGLRRSGGSRMQPSSAICYVADVSSGLVVAYAIPWAPPMYAAGQTQSGQLARVGPPTHFRQGGITGPGGGSAFGEEKSKKE
jgi:hypothetical protein